jgi:predicted O-methyltransferase YrrM
MRRTLASPDKGGLAHHQRAEFALQGRSPMDYSEATGIISRLYKYLLQRAPAPDELEQWAGALVVGTTVASIIDRFSESEEFKLRNGVVPFFPNGHYYSAIVNPDAELRRYVEAQPARIGSAPQQIPIDTARMNSFFRQNAAIMASAKIAETQVPQQRFYAQNGGYPLGDALVLRAMINHLRPRRIIEVGSGFSTACMLDTLDELGHRARITCIEPYPDRLRSLLRKNDDVEVLESPVQDIPVDRFTKLEAGDILFIDSTHVVKTGSDVHYEIFEVLPRLQAGVMVHFHDVPYPFEYPQEWIFGDNYSWNEAYFVRAFLMYNRAFSIFFSGSYMRLHSAQVVAEHFAGFPANPGTNLWLKKEG